MRESCNQLRLKGNQAYRCHDLYTAKTFYLQALNQLKKLLQITKVNPEWVNTEYARISANLSLLELTQGHLPEALAASMESIRMNHTWAKVGIHIIVDNIRVILHTLETSCGSMFYIIYTY